MKTASKRTILTVILAIVFVCTLTVGAWLVAMQNNKVAYAVGEGGSTATLTTNTTKVKRDGTVDVTLTVPMPSDVANNNNYYWGGVALAVGPLNADKTGFDTELAKELSVATKDGAMCIDFGDLQPEMNIEGDDYKCYDIKTTGDYFTKPSNAGSGFFYWSFGTTGEVIDSDTGAPYDDMVYHGTLTLTVTICVPADFSADEITFGVGKVPAEKAAIGSINDKKSEAITLSPFDIVGTSKLTTTEVKVEVVDVATEANLVKVDVGHGASLDKDALTTVNYYDEETTSYKETGTYDCEHFAMFPLVLQPTLADDTTGAVVKFGFDADTVATSGTVLDTEQGWVSLEKPEGETTPTSVYIYVQAENCEVGEDGTVTSGKTKTYELKLESSYIGLSDLVFKDYSVVTDAVYAGLFSVPESGDAEEVEFDPEVLEYRYYLLSDSLKQEGDESLTLSLTASVPENAGINTQVAVAEVAETPALTIPDDAGKSGEEFDIEVPTDSASYVVTLTVIKEDDAEVKKVYTIHLDVKNCDVSLKVQVKGPQPSANIYNSSDSKALENSVDFYFALNKETITDPDTDAVFDRLVTETAVKSTVDLYEGENKLGEVNDNTKAKSDMEIQEVLGTYKLLVTAEAGNTKEYTFICAAPGALSLTLESEYQFWYVTTEDDTDYRTAYGENDLVHGKDDRAGNEHGISRYVLGQILPVTTIKSFIENIDATQHEIMWIYDHNDRLIYKLGNVETQFADDFDAAYFPVGTGWRVELKVSEDATPIDVVYLSILGDVNSDGIINALDTSVMNTQIIAGTPFDRLEIQLATTVYYTKENILSGNCVSTVNDIIRGDADVTATFYKKTPATVDPNEPAE